MHHALARIVRGMVVHIHLVDDVLEPVGGGGDHGTHHLHRYHHDCIAVNVVGVPGTV